MAKKLNKTKLIKKYFGDVIKEYGFEYGGAEPGHGIFSDKKKMSNRRSL